MFSPEILKQYQSSRDVKNKTRILCYGPFTNMNFEQNGNASICCFNRKDILGTFPQNTLMEMWEGNKLKDFRTVIQKDELPDGCYTCRRELINKNWFGVNARQFDRFESGVDVYSSERIMPQIMEFELSNQCNLECIMCSSHFSSSIENRVKNCTPKCSPYSEDFVNQLEQFMPYVKEMNFLGGEPFLIKLYYRIWDSIAVINPEIKVRITTNGTILNSKVKKILDKLNASIVISIDSFEKTTYEQIRKNAIFERVQANISYFLDYTRRKKTICSMAVCPMRNNWQEIPSILNYCNKNDVTIYFNQVLRPANLSLRTLKKDQILDIIKYLNEFSPNLYSPVSRYNYEKYKALIAQLLVFSQKASEGDFMSDSVKKTYNTYLEAFHLAVETESSSKIQEETIPLALNILKRLAFETSIKIKENEEYFFDPDDLFYDDPNFAYLNLTIRKQLESLRQSIDIKTFFDSFSDVVKHVVLIITSEDPIIDTTPLPDKIDQVFDLVAENPAREQILDNIIESDCVQIINALIHWSFEQISQQLSHEYGSTSDTTKRS